MIHTIALDPRSEQRLEGVNAALANLTRRAIRALPFDVLVVEGLRSRQRQSELYAQGRTKPGKIVTWTLESKHLQGRAVDLAPIADGVVLWGDSKKFDAISVAMFDAAAEVGVAIRWGRDWNQNGKAGEKGEGDSPHFELL